MERLPRIAISSDLEKRLVRGHELAHPYLAGWYPDAVAHGGGLPFILPPGEPSRAAQYIDQVDGLVISGGDFDIDPAKYGRPRHPKLGNISVERTEFELALLAAAEARGLPVLGVCGGMQLINVARGGSLHQHLDDERPGPFNHRQPGDKREPHHKVKLSGILAELCQSTTLGVNSTHHQGVLALGRDLQCVAVADDGLCEALSDPSRHFFVGVQWHPEAMHERPEHLAIYRGLVAAARVYRAG